MDLPGSEVTCKVTQLPPAPPAPKLTELSVSPAARPDGQRCHPAGGSRPRCPGLLPEAMSLGFPGETEAPRCLLTPVLTPCFRWL